MPPSQQPKQFLLVVPLNPLRDASRGKFDVQLRLSGGELCLVGAGGKQSCSGGCLATKVPHQPMGKCGEPGSIPVSGEAGMLGSQAGFPVSVQSPHWGSELALGSISGVLRQTAQEGKSLEKNRKSPNPNKCGRKKKSIFFVSGLKKC